MHSSPSSRAIALVATHQAYLTEPRAVASPTRSAGREDRRQISPISANRLPILVRHSSNELVAQSQTFEIHFNDLSRNKHAPYCFMQLPGPTGLLLPVPNAGEAAMPRRLNSQRKYGKRITALSLSSSSGCVHILSAAAMVLGMIVASKSEMSTTPHNPLDLSPYSPHMHTSPPWMRCHWSLVMSFRLRLTHPHRPHKSLP